MGTASWATDSTDYWRALETAAASREYPRGTERRHFRGNLATSSVEALAASYDSAESLVGYLRGSGSDTLEAVLGRAKSLRGFGPWIAFKVADMLERLGLCSIVFDGGSLYMFDSPSKGATEAWERYGKPGKEPPEDICGWASDYLLDKLGDYLAPPSYERPINVQETETILCKWHSHLGGHYEVGKDTHEIRESLLRFARCKTSQKLLKGLKHA